MFRSIRTDEMNRALYFIVINIIGFLLGLLNKHFNRKLDNGVVLASFLGGSLGVLLFLILIDRPIQKEVMLSFVVSICLSFIQISCYIFSKNGYTITVKMNREIIIYFIIMTILTFFLFGLDKKRAQKHKWRIKVFTLLGMCFLGGSLGGLIAMYVFHHKTKQKYFTWGVPLILITQVFCLFAILSFS